MGIFDLILALFLALASPDADGVPCEYRHYDRVHVPATAPDR